MVDSTRRLTGAVLALLGAIAVVWSAFIGWYNGRNGSNIRVGNLFNNLTTAGASTFGSLFLPLGIAALVALIGIALQFRMLWVLAAAIALCTVFLWGLRQAQTLPGLHAQLVGPGPGLAAGGGALMLLAAYLATGKARRSTARHQRAGEPELVREPAGINRRTATTTQPQAAVQDEWDGSGQAYQQGYREGQGQASEPTPETTETYGRRGRARDPRNDDK